MTKQNVISKLVIKKGFKPIEDISIVPPRLQKFAEQMDLDMLALRESMGTYEKQMLVLRGDALYYVLDGTSYKLDIPDFSENRRKRKRGKR